MTPERWRKVKELYGCARERQGEERASFLRHACSDDELRIEVESLLASEEAAGGFMTTSGMPAAVQELASVIAKLPKDLAFSGMPDSHWDWEKIQSLYHQ